MDGVSLRTVSRLWLRIVGCESRTVFIAGSDPYEKDTLTAMNISREGMLKRNLYVYRKFRKEKIPLIVIAGGGYGADSWEVYYDFIAYCLKNKY